VRYTFTGGADGANPKGDVIRDGSGNLYGTTLDGGAHGYGVVFKLNLNGKETVLHTFTGGSDGSQPYAGLVRDSVGNLYGTTFNGSSSGSCSGPCGSVFKLSSDGTKTVLYYFTYGPNGTSPEDGLVEDSAGNLYGTTYYGGAHDFGAVFKVTPGGQESVLLSFTGGNDGGNPIAGLIKDKAGNLYGTTTAGEGCGSVGCGTVFKLAPNGKETVLYYFQGGTHGEQPYAAVLRDKDGNLFGTTYEGGAELSYGTVFKLAPNGKETVLHAFKNGKDGSYPEGDLIEDSDGNLYGTTAAGGMYGYGTVFKLAPDGKETRQPLWHDHQWRQGWIRRRLRALGVRHRSPYAERSRRTRKYVAAATN
jgi:uncharacterized repeat protein (TIGR03803 family)